MKENAQESEKTELIDQGSCFVYWHLSYRRRVIRDIWTVVITFVASGFLYLFFPDLKVVLYIVPLFGIPQILYNLYKWKTIEKTPLKIGFNVKPRSTIDEEYKSALKSEFIIYGGMSIICSVFSFLASTIYFWYMAQKIKPFVKESTFFIFMEEYWMVFFFNVFLFSLPAFMISIYIFKNKFGNKMLEDIYKSSEKIWGLSKKFSKTITISMLLITSLIGACFNIYSLSEYSIFAEKRIQFSRGFSFELTEYKYEDIENIYEVKFFYNSAGEPLYLPHFVIKFKDKKTWASREHIQNDTFREDQLKNLIVERTEITPKKVRYFENK